MQHCDVLIIRGELSAVRLLIMLLNMEEMYRYWKKGNLLGARLST